MVLGYSSDDPAETELAQVASDDQEILPHTYEDKSWQTNTQLDHKITESAWRVGEIKRFSESFSQLTRELESLTSLSDPFHS